MTRSIVPITLLSHYMADPTSNQVLGQNLFSHELSKNLKNQ